jgi:hypothetical protein
MFSIVFLWAENAGVLTNIVMKVEFLEGVAILGWEDAYGLITFAWFPFGIIFVTRILVL